MFEFDKYDRKLLQDQPSSPTASYEPELALKQISLLFWAEHCVECAAPSCYETCDLYQPRSDKRCRRFTFGTLKNRRFRSFRGYGVEVSFKKWAKIETVGNISMAPLRTVLRHEKLLEWGASLGNLAGKLMGLASANANWSSASYIGLQRLVHRLGHTGRERDFPEAFLLEVYNPLQETVRMQLSFGPFVAEGLAASSLVPLGPSFVTTLAFPRGYSRHQIDASLLRSVLTAHDSFKISMIPEADNNARLVFLTADFVTFANKPAKVTEVKPIKCVVWDLDNTLWDGILIEGDKVALHPEVKRLIEHLDARGILLSIASKNDHVSAWQKLQELGIDSYFLYPQLSWAPKSEGIKTIAEQLNIGVDTLAFIDDNPFEIDQVGQALPDVVCINAGDVASLLSDPRFQGSTSAEARQRRRFYQEAISREQAQAKFGSNYSAFLASSGVILQVAQYSPRELERIAELVQRTNQLNFSGHKYTREQLNGILDSPRFEKYVLKCSDSYGSYGTVGFAIIEHGTGVIRVLDFMLSCRVQGKFIEQAFFYHIAVHHNPESASTLWVNFHQTARNKPAQQVLDLLGFRNCDPVLDQLREGVIHAALDTLRCDFIRIDCSAAPSEIIQEPSASLLSRTTSSQA